MSCQIYYYVPQGSWCAKFGWNRYAILKTVKSPYLRNRLTDFYEIWHCDANWPVRGQTVKISNFSKTKMAAAAILKITKIAIFSQQLERSLRNLARLYKIGFLTVLTVKKLSFQNPRWRMSANMKTVKSPYLRNRLLILMKFGTMTLQGTDG